MEDAVKQAERVYAADPTPCNEQRLSRARARAGIVLKVRVSPQALWDMHYPALRDAMPSVQPSDRLAHIAKIMRLLPCQDTVDEYLRPAMMTTMLDDISAA